MAKFILPLQWGFIAMGDTHRYSYAALAGLYNRPMEPGFRYLSCY